MVKSNVELGQLKGKYGWISVHALRSWNFANMRARKEYYDNPFINGETNTRQYRRWTRSEVLYLKKARRQGRTYQQIADYLGRKVTNVQNKADKLGLVKKKR